MKKINWYSVLFGTILVLALVAGTILLANSLRMFSRYTEDMDAARQSLTQADPAQADALETELAALQEENRQLEAEAEELEEENSALDEETAQLQQEYDALAQQEENVYYQTILDALTEGMNLVDGYLNP